MKGKHDSILHFIHQDEFLLTVYLTGRQNTSGEFRESTPYLWGAGTNAL
jgi:hypothetical protein